MADLRRVKLMRGNESTRTTVIPEQGEQISTIDELKVYLGDGIKPGGYVVNADNTIAICENQAISSAKHSLAWWINWFNGSNATIRIPKGIHNISTSMTVPSNICLKFDKGAYFNVTSGVTLTVNGDIDAGIWEVYTGSGTVNGTAYHPTRPEMPTPEYTDDSDRIATTAFVKNQVASDTVKGMVELATPAEVLAGEDDERAVTPAGLSYWSKTPVGAIVTYPVDSIPSHCLECNGAAISRVTYSKLFETIGTVYGAGDGSTTFQLPDLRGEFIRGWDNARGIDASRVIGSEQADEFKAHTHDYYSLTSGGSVGSGGSYVEILNVSRSTGGTETRPRNIAMMYCIVYE